MSRSSSGEVRRLFVSVDPPPDAVADLGTVVDSLQVSLANAPGRSTRVTARERWHVTLAFLGDVPVRRVDVAAAALDRAVVDEAMREVTPIRVCFAGGGRFGRGPFTILWAGLGGDVGALRTLAQTVRRELGRARLPFDGKGFRPHVTISRPGTRVEPELIETDVATLEAYEGPMWTVDAMSLMASRLGPKPTYTPLHRAPLQ